MYTIDLDDNGPFVAFEGYCDGDGYLLLHHGLWTDVSGLASHSTCNHIFISIVVDGTDHASLAILH